MKLITVVAQDARNNNVLMVAYANKEALRLTRKTGWMHYWSRSRQKLWKKGETSGNLQKVVSLHYDCDRDAILARVIQTGPACHRNTKTCFSDKYFRGSGILDELWEVFRDRKRKPKKGSYTNKLLKDRDELAKKLIEEASELALAARGRKRKQIKWEAADLLYHTLLTLFTSGLRMEDVEEELRRRRK